jgi:hypothetical protein
VRGPGIAATVPVRAPTVALLAEACPPAPTMLDAWRL